MDFAAAAEDFRPRRRASDDLGQMRDQMKFSPSEQAAQYASDRTPESIAELQRSIAAASDAPIAGGPSARSILKSQLASFSSPVAAPRYDFAAAADHFGGQNGVGRIASVPITVQPSVNDAPTPGTWGAVKADLNQTNVPTASAAILGAGKGVFDTLVGGPAQLIAHGVSSAARGLGAAPDSVLGSLDASVDDATKSREAIFNDITQGHGTAAGVGQVVGGAASALALPIGRVAEGAGLVSRLLTAGKAGAAVGAAQPVVDTENYWAHKAAETALGGLAGTVAQPIAELGAKAIGTLTSKAIDAGKSVAAKVTGGTATGVPSTASPELQAVVKSAQASGRKIDPIALNRQVEADSLPIKMSLTPGQASQDPIAISTEANLRSKNPEMVHKFQDQNTQLVQNLNAIRESSAPNAVAPDHITAGQTVIDALAEKNQALNKATGAAYKALEDANGGTLPLDGRSFAIDANKALGKNMKAAFLPREIQGILEKFQTGEQPMTFENFENLRTILATSARSAKDGNVSGALNTVRNTLENMPMAGGAEDIKPLADQARRLAKQHFDLLDVTPSLKAVDAGRATPDDFIQKHVISAKRGDLVNTINALADGPQALETLKAGVVNYLKKSAGIIDDQGNFSQAGYNKAFAAIKPKLDVLFDAGEAKQLQTIGNVARYTQAQPRGSYVNNSNTDVANLARTGGAMLAHGVNVATGTPVGSIASGLISKSMAEKASATQLRDMLGTGAGISKPSQTSVLLKDVLPPYAGRVAALPLAKLSADQVK